VALIRFCGHQTREGYGVKHGSRNEEADSEASGIFG
jgi:hypothetical protein